MSQYAHLSNVDPEFEPIRKTLGPPPDVAKDIVAFRTYFNEQLLPKVMSDRGPKLPPESAYRVRDYQIPVEGGEMAIRCLTPTPAGASKDQRFPLFYWIHGGGWVFCDLDCDDFMLREICVKLQVSIVNIDYRLAPEHLFPTGLNDCYEGLKWAASHPEVLLATTEKGFIIGGHSSGGNYAAGLALRARDDPFFEGRRITGQILQTPALIHPEAYPDKYKDQLLAMEQNKNAPILNRKTMDDYYNMLQPRPADPEFSPVLATSHAGLPPIYQQTCGLDPLRDDVFLYEKILNEAGVPTKTDVYPGLPHSFNLYWPHLAQSVKYEEDMFKGLKWLLSQ